ncbi:hypothetical protein G7074_11040 [Pedobacter sp. HDW13]|uniref:energy transducer TonB n=1 Tax=unclassified Pedobacter TaxID=2628915 RepID=UPI000F5A20FB|nr:MULTISPECIES: hypothetical protein [unclassified Pedobacter]QIL39752.1 hypothetical protein G7074_11040 [Pedobacter sp. HDW13]RQO79762.1 hypothetical protein DBR40_02060 [Pedobacter sp. KBW01]
MFRLMLTVSILASTVLGYFINQNPITPTNNKTDCIGKKDLITGKVIYTSYDVPATNEGGQAKLYRAMINVRLDSIPSRASTQFMVSFLVDADGRISRERVVKDEVGKVGEQMLKIAKSFKWTPAMCNGKKVATITTLSSRICLL